MPLLLAAAVYGVMLVWHAGAQAVSARLQETVIPVANSWRGSPRAGFRACPVPPCFSRGPCATRRRSCVWHVKQNRALHERLFVLTVITESVPWIGDAARLQVEEIAPGFWRATARYGFMERPDIPALLQKAHAGGCGIDLSDVTYYVGHETVVRER